MDEQKDDSIFGKALENIAETLKKKAEKEQLKVQKDEEIENKLWEGIFGTLQNTVKLKETNKDFTIDKEEIKSKITDFIGNMIFEKLSNKPNIEIKNITNDEQEELTISEIEALTNKALELKDIEVVESEVIANYDKDANEVMTTAETPELTLEVESTTGLAIRWRGELNKLPNRPKDFDFYRDSRYGAVYIYYNKKWNLFVKDGESIKTPPGGGLGKKDVIALIQQYAITKVSASDVSVSTSAMTVLTSDNAQGMLEEIDGFLAAGGTGGEINSGTNIGDGIGIYAGKSSTVLNFRSILSEGSVSIFLSGDTIVVSGIDSWSSVSGSYYAAEIVNTLLNTKLDTSAANFVNLSGDTMDGQLNVPSLSADILYLNINGSETPVTGSITWNSNEKTFDFGLENNVVLQLGQEFIIYVHNETGVDIQNGTTVYITSGSDDNNLHIGIASNDDINAYSTIGIATQNIPNGSSGYITKLGRIRGINSSNLIANGKIYLGTSGNIVSAKPEYPARNIELGYCIISHATSGMIFVDINKQFAIEDLYNVFLDSISEGDSLIYENNKWINRNFGSITKEATGFKEPENVIVSYDSVTKRITLDGSVEAYWRSNSLPVLSAGWVSPELVTPSQTNYLYYNGTDFVWSEYPWNFYDLQIAFVSYNVSGDYVLALRECHGTMPWQAHEEFHQTVGCYLKSGGDINNYVLGSTVSADRTVHISDTVVKDEDLESFNAAHNGSYYSQISLITSASNRLLTSGVNIVKTIGNQPYYDYWNGTTWVDTPFSNNSFGVIFVVASPCTNDTISYNRRFLFTKPQTTFGSLEEAELYTTNNLTFGNPTTLPPEFVFIGKIIIRYQSANWFISKVEKITGTKSSQTNTVGNYLSQVSHDNTLSGAGTPQSLLGINDNRNIIPLSANTYTIGTSAVKFKSVYATSGIFNNLAGDAYYLTNVQAVSALSAGEGILIDTSIKFKPLISIDSSYLDNKLSTKLDISAYIDNDSWALVSADYYTKSEVDIIVSAISGDNDSWTSVSADYYTSIETDNKLSAKLDVSAYVDNDSWTLVSADYYNSAEVDMLLDNKLDSSAYIPIDTSAINNWNSVYETVFDSSATWSSSSSAIALDDLTNVAISSQSNGNTLVYVSAIDEWQNYGNLYALEYVTTLFYQKYNNWDWTFSAVNVSADYWNSVYETVFDSSATWSLLSSGDSWSLVSGDYYTKDEVTSLLDAKLDISAAMAATVITSDDILTGNGTSASPLSADTTSLVHNVSGANQVTTIQVVTVMPTTTVPGVLYFVLE